MFAGIGDEDGASMETLRPSVWHELRETFADRAINVRTLPRTLRIVVGAAYAQIVVAVALLAVRAFGLDSAATQLLTIQGQHMPTITYGFVLLAVPIAWATILTGAFLAHPVARIVLLATFTLFYSALSNASGGLGGFLALILVAGLWIALFVSLFRKPTSFRENVRPAARHDRRNRDLDVCRFRRIARGGLAFRGVVHVCDGQDRLRALRRARDGRRRTRRLGATRGTGIGALLVRLRATRARALVVAAAALGLVAFALETAYGSYIVSALPLIAVAACVVAVIAYSARRFGTPRSIHIPWFAIAGASILYAISLAAGPLVDGARKASNVDYVAYESGEHRETFRLDMPTMWHEVDFGSSDAQGSYFSDAANRAAFAVVAFPLPEARIPKSGVVVAAEERPSRIVSSRVVGYDREFLVKKPYGLERIVVRRLRGKRVTWQLESRDTVAEFQSRRATFDHIRESFKVGEETNPHNGFGTLGVAIMSVVGLVALLTLLRRFTVAAAFFAIFSVLYVGENIDHFVATMTGGTGSGHPSCASARSNLRRARAPSVCSRSSRFDATGVRTCVVAARIHDRRFRDSAGALRIVRCGDSRG